MVSPVSLAFMALAALISVAVPVGAMLWIWSRRTPDGARRWPHVWRPFAVGALAFVLAQVVTRMPLMALVVPNLPEPWPSVLMSGAAASFSAGLFEETARLLLMLWLLTHLRRWIGSRGLAARLPRVDSCGNVIGRDKAMRGVLQRHEFIQRNVGRSGVGASIVVQHPV